MNDTLPQPAPGPLNMPLLPAKRTNIKLVLKIVILAVVLAIVGFGVILATKIWDPVWSPFRADPEKVVAAAFAKMLTVNALHSEMKIAIVADAPLEKTKMSFSITAKVDSDLKNPGEEKSAADIDLSANISSASFPIAFSLSLKTKQIGSDQFILLSDVSAPNLAPILAMAGIDLADFSGQWLKMDQQTVETLGFPSLTAEQLMQGEQLQAKIGQIFAQNKFFSVQKELADKTIGGQKLYSYVLIVDKANAAKSLIDLFTLVSGSIAPGEENIIPAAAQLQSGLEVFFDKVGDITFEVLIGKKDNLIYGIKLDKTIDVSKIDAREKGTFSVQFEIMNSKFNEPISIKAPDNFRKIEEIIAPFLQRLSEETNRSRVTDRMGELRDVAEEIFFNNKNSYTKFNCSNVTVKPLCDEIRSLAGVQPIIKTSATKYCAYVRLPEISLMPGEIGMAVEYDCVSNNSSNGPTGIDPSKSGYCTGRTFVCPQRSVSDGFKL